MALLVFMLILFSCEAFVVYNLQSKLSLLAYKAYRVQTKHVNNVHVTAL